MGNLDETHVLYDQDSHRLLGDRGETEIDYHDVISGTEGMTVLIRIYGRV